VRALVGTHLALGVPVSLAEATAHAKHDLGKYVAFQLRWIAPDASDDELLDALRADVLNTRRGPSGRESAMDLWSRLRPTLEGADVSPIDRAIDRLEDCAAGIERGTLTRAEMEQCAAVARSIATALAGLARTHRS